MSLKAPWPVFIFSLPELLLTLCSLGVKSRLGSKVIPEIPGHSRLRGPQNAWYAVGHSSISNVALWVHSGLRPGTGISGWCAVILALAYISVPGTKGFRLSFTIILVPEMSPGGI